MESQNIPNEELITNNNKLISAVNDDQDKNQKLPSTLNEKFDTNSSGGKKKKNESFEEEDEAILYNDDDEENEIIDEYELMEDKKLRAMDDIKNMEERIKNNEKKIEELKNNLTILKEEKNKKQNDIMNLLSNKESLEEIYKNQLYSLNNTNNNSSGSNNFNENTTLANDINNLNNLMNDNSVIGLNSNHNITILDNEILNTDEENFKIELKEIKESEKDKFIEQVINMFEDIFKKKDEDINKSITNIIKNSYELFINNNEENNDENNNEISVMNFFGKISLFIWNQNTSKFTESKINLLLRYLLKINYINTKLTKYLKFVNKKYKEKKRQILDLIDSLEKKNLSLKEKIARLENKLKEYEEKKILYDDDNEEEGEEEDELSHEVVIEYEDGIDKNAEINYEDEDIDDNDIEKENEMINKGENPYNRKQSNIIKNNKKNNNKNNNQIIVKDNDESEDKYLHEFLENNQNKKNKEKKNIINQDNKNNNENNAKKNYIKIDPKKDDENNKKKIKNINNEKNIINLDKNKRPFPTPQHHIRREEDEIQNLTAIEQNKYDRVQRIMNSGPKYGIFGVNKYNPENNPNKEGLFSPRRNNKYPRSSNKIDKTFKIQSRQNHNFFGIINMTKVAAIKKKKNKKTKENEEENEGEIKIINLEENFNNEEGKEDTINVNNDNENNNNDIIKDNNNRDNEKRDNNKEININQNKNNIQGYYLNIINKKKVNNNEDNINNNNLNNNNNNSIKKEIKMHKLPHQPYTSSRLTGKKSYKFPRTKDLNLNNDNNTQNQIINKIYEAKPYLNINTSPTYDKKLNDLNKRSNSFSVNQNEEENNKNLAYRNQFKTHKIMVINNNNYKIDNINNYNTSPTNQTVIKKISRIPMSKMVVPGNKNYNANAYEKINFKAGGNKYQVLNKNKK